MNATKFNKVIEDVIDKCKNTLCQKAEEYATHDRLHNFKVAAGIQGITNSAALAGMMAKHTVSIYDMATSDEVFPLAMWDEKICDHINYLLLLKALVIDEGESE